MTKGIVEISNLAQLFSKAGDVWKKQPAFATRNRGKIFEMVSYGSWWDRVLSLATGLIELGVKAKDHIGLLSDNCFEWILIDAAIQCCGSVNVPRGSDITSAEMAYIIAHADVKILFLESQKLLDQWRSLKEKPSACSRIIMMKTKEQTGVFVEPVAGDKKQEVMTLASLEALGKRLREVGDRRVEERMEQLRPDDLYTIIYTSGTTGTPKGVQLTHASICSQVKHLATVLVGDAKSNKSLLSQEPLRALSILPIWHSFERVFEMFVISQGGCTYYSSLRSLAQDLKEVCPNVMASAPRLWEVLYEKIMAEVKRQSSLKKFLFNHVIQNEWLAALFQRWNLPPLPQLRSVVGGALRITISGGGALPPYVDQFFNRIGIAVLEGYGLTESGPVIAVRTPERLVIGTVGPLLPETEIKVIDLENGTTLYPDPALPDLGLNRRGEICARGPQMMKGYYKDPEGTARVLREGWLHTGDIGVMTMEFLQTPSADMSSCVEPSTSCFTWPTADSARAPMKKDKGLLPMLKIVGRCKETIVLLNGENVEPLPIESRLLQSPFIEQCMVVGQDQKHLGVLIVPATQVVSQQESDPEKQYQLFQSEIRRLISTEHGFKSFEKIGPWRLLPKPFEVGHELTGTYKLKRHVITERYRELITEMFCH